MLVASLSAPPPVSRKFGPLRLFKRLMPREDGFFELFARHAETVVGGADALGAMFAGEAGIEESCRRIAEFEHQADTVTRDVLHAVRRSFITTFDRSAITATLSSMDRSEEHTSELQSLMRNSYAVFCLTKKINQKHSD